MDNDQDRDAGGRQADILIVDDRPAQLLVYQTILEDIGQTLFTAASGEEALKQVLDRDFAAILLDVNMPGLNGLETAALIRGRSRSAHIPIIFITADYGDELHTAQAYSLGAVDYIASPVVPEILRAKIKVFVDLYLLAQQAKHQAEEHLALAEERAARAAAEQASRRLSFLAQASVALAGSLDFDAITRELARLCVPSLADGCGLTLVAHARDSAGNDVALVAGDPQRIRSTARLASDMPDGWLRLAMNRVLASGIAEVIHNLSDAVTESDGRALADYIGAPAGSGIACLAIVPLLGHGITLGVLTLGLGPSGRHFDADTLSMATELAGRAAIALDNARLYEKSQADDRRKDEFLAMLAHELRNPLAPISNAVHVLHLSAQDPAKLTWAREVIGRQLRQLVRLVDDLLDVSRITRGKIELKLGPIDVAKVVGAAVETSRALVDALEHELTVGLPPEPLLVMGDFARVAQILSNLINNAAKYTDKGGRISVTASGERGQVVFRVRDSGVGIPPHLLSSIFELFTQADRTLGRAQGGLGVGLALVRRLVAMQGGSVSAYSEGPDRGSEFTVRLPAANATKAVDEESLETPSRPVTTAPDACILIVDDNHDVADSTAMLLRAVGWKVHLAYDGEEAIRSARMLHPDAVLLDIGLPGVDGYQVAERIRAEPGNQAPLIVAVSGYGQEEHRRRSKRAGFDHHVVKPIDPTVLTQLLASALHSRHAAAQTAVAFPHPRPVE
jgi:signal transduction histidine kinase/DNA-binding response OmpR family regulator